MRALLSLAVFAAAPLTAQSPVRQELRGDSVAIYNLAGEVRVEAGGGAAVTVDITLRGADAKELRVEAGPIGGINALRVIYPGDDIVYGSGTGRSSTELRVRDDGTFSDDRGRGGREVRVRNYGSGTEAWADLVVRVPAGKSVAVRLAVGEVTIANVDGNLLIDVHSADVTSTGTKGVLSIDTGSGDVTVKDAQGTVSLDTGSGNVEATNVTGTSLTLDTGSGDVTVAQADVTDLSIDTGSGDVDLTGVRAKHVKVDTTSCATADCMIGGLSIFNARSVRLIVPSGNSAPSPSKT